MASGLLEIVIPVHSATRPIARAVASVLGSHEQDVRVTVVCHNIVVGAIKPLLAEFKHDRRLRFLELLDSEPLASLPRNFGIVRSEAEYVAFLDSDDEFEEGAIDAWCAELVDAPQLLIGQIASESGVRIHAPAPRPKRFDNLHPVNDLLNYRTAPLGVMIRRNLLLSDLSPGYRLGMQTGEDMALGLYLWNFSTSIKYSRSRLGYLVHSDATDRVTARILSPKEQFEAVREALEMPMFLKLSRRKRQAIALKFLRTQVFGYLLGRVETISLTQDILDESADLLGELSEFAPGMFGYLDVAEMLLVRAIEDKEPSKFIEAHARGTAIPSYLKVITSNPLRTFASESPLGRERRGKGLLRHFGN